MCLQFPGTSVCGLFGSCSANNTCVCDPGWEPSLELVFFPFIRDDRLDDYLGEEEDLLKQLPCSKNDTVMRVCFALSFVGNLVALSALLPQLKGFRRCLRALPLLVSFVCFALVGGIRMYGDGVDRSFTSDFRMAATGSLGVLGQSFASNVFSYKYVNYHILKMNKLGNHGVVLRCFDTQRLLQYITPLLLVTDVIISPLLTMPAVLQDQRVAGILEYTCICYYLFRVTFQAAVLYLAVSGLIKDMRKYVKTARFQNAENDRLLRFCRDAPVNLRLLIMSSLAFAIPQGLSHIIYLSFYGLEGMKVYSFTCLNFAWAVNSCTVGYLLKKNAAIKKKSKKLVRATENQISFPTSRKTERMI